MLRIEGRMIQELILGAGDIVVLPPLTEDPVPVPAGDYICKTVKIQSDQQRRTSPQTINDITVTVPTDGEGVLKVGGPFQHALRVERMGSILKFNYELKGIGGEIYDAQQIMNYDNEKAPSVAIYKGDLQLASGKFEYG
jgi:hypothetical protein